MSEHMRKEVQLAKVGIKEEVGRAGKGGGMLGAGAMAGYVALLFASLALAWLLDQVMPRPRLLPGRRALRDRRRGPHHPGPE